MALLLVGTPFFLLFYRFHEGQLIEGLRTSAVNLSRVVTGRLEAAMERRAPHSLEGELGRLSESLGMERVTILNPQGEVRFSSDPGLKGKVYAKNTDPNCRSCHQSARAPREDTIFVKDQQDRIVFRNMTPIYNQPRCFACHRPEQKINGIILLDLSASDLQKRLLMDTRQMLGLGATMLLVTLVALHLLLNKLVLQKLKKLARTSLRIAQGNLDERIHLPGKDEIGRLAENLNDMTDSLRRAWQEAKHHNDYLEEVINSIDDEIIVVDRARCVVLANHAYLSKHTRTREEIVGEFCFLTAQNSSIPCGPDLIRNCPVQAALEKGELKKEIYTFTDPDGNEKFVEIHCFPLRDKQGDIFQAIEVRRDITERRRLEASLCHSERLASLGLLASGVSHEINNPLASIITAIQGLQRRLKAEVKNSGPEHADLEEYLDLIHKEAMRAKSITERLLVLSQKSESSAYLVSINKSLSETISLLRFQAAEQRIQIREDLDERLPTLKANDPALRQVFLNLLLNALQAIGQDGVIRVKTAWVDPTVRIAFEDSGCGIEKKDLKRIFEPFISRRRSGKGTGLGLFIADQIVRQLGGHITVESEVGKGSRFTVALPGHSG